MTKPDSDMAPERMQFQPTHEVQNQPPALADVNLYASNLALREAVTRGHAGWAENLLLARGEELGSAEMSEHARLANRNAPVLAQYDRFGRRVDDVEFHPSYHHLFAWAKGNGLDTGPWADPRPGAHVARAALFATFSEIEQGVCCPITMTYGVVPTVADEPALAREWLPRLLAREYDPRALPGPAKRGVTMGMGLTEKQGGSDVQANTTRAFPVADGGRGRDYRLVGHKWFFSAPMSDAFLVTAHTDEGISCFFVPRFAPDGNRNAIRLRRLKDKLGDRSNAGAEAEFEGAHAVLVGEPGRGIPTVLKMGTFTRLDCALGSTGTMRRALAEAIHHCTHRKAFGQRLVDQPLMRNVLADLALEVEAATALSMRVAEAFDREAHDERETLIKRLLTPVAKFHVCKRAAAMVQEAMECLGGNGYVEDSALPRLYRQAPLNSIWEGAGNIMCLDVLRAVARTPKSLEALDAEWDGARSRHAGFRAAADAIRRDVADAASADESAARQLTLRLAIVTQAALLLRHAPEFVADAFCASRFAAGPGGAFGMLPRETAFAEIIARALPC